jgi:hypothetical protein
VGAAIKSWPVSEARSGASVGGGTAAYRSVAGKRMAAAIELRRGRDIKDITHVPIKSQSRAYQPA